MIRTLIACVAMEFGAGGFATVAAQDLKQDAERYLNLTNQVFFYDGASQTPQSEEMLKLWKDKPRMASLSQELHDIVGRTILRQAFASRDASGIVRAVKVVQGKTTQSWDDVDPSRIILPYADLAEISGLPTLVSAFMILEGGYGIPDSLSYIQFYSSDGEGYKLKAEVSDDFRQFMFQVRRVPSSNPNEVWYLVWGTRWGDNGARMRVRLYGFDGSSLRTIYQREGLYGGSLTVSGDRVDISYQDFERRFIVEQAIHEHYRIGGDGLVPLAQ